jgi:hypothetical protein
MFTWEGISYLIKGFISNTNVVILVLVNSSESPYSDSVSQTPVLNLDTPNTLNSSETPTNQ